MAPCQRSAAIMAATLTWARRCAPLPTLQRPCLFSTAERAHHLREQQLGEHAVALRCQVLAVGLMGEATQAGVIQPDDFDAPPLHPVRECRPGLPRPCPPCFPPGRVAA